MKDVLTRIQYEILTLECNLSELKSYYTILGLRFAFDLSSSGEFIKIVDKFLSEIADNQQFILINYITSRRD